MLLFHTLILETLLVKIFFVGWRIFHHKLLMSFQLIVADFSFINLKLDSQKKKKKVE